LTGTCSFRTKGHKEFAFRVELLDTMIVKVRHKDISPSPGRDGCCHSEPTVDTTRDINGQRASPFVKEGAIRAEDLDTIIVSIRHNQVSVRVKGNICRIIEETRKKSLLSGLAVLPDEFTVWFQKLDSMIKEVSHIKSSLMVYSHSGGGIELSGAGTGGSNESKRFSFQGEGLYSVVEIIGHVQFIALNVQMHRPVKLPQSAALVTKLPHEPAVSIKYLNPVVTCITHENLVCGNRDPDRFPKLTGSSSVCPPCVQEPVPLLL